MRKSFLFTITSCLIFGSVPAQCQEKIIPAEVLERLQAITERIRSCEEQDITPVDPSSNQRLPFKLLQGPPLNVTWDIKKSDSLIKPYYGVIEFVTYSRMWAPDSLLQKNRRLADMVTENNLKPDSLRHRYVFEPVHGGLELTTMTQIGEDQKEMTEPLTYRCWQLAAGVKKPQ